MDVGLSLDIGQKKKIFVKSLLKWSKKHLATYPWRRTKDPYHILMAELMLQRTKADQVAGIYSAFLEKFPSASVLAGSEIADIHSSISSLGLAYRETRLKNIAESLTLKYSGKVPKSKDDLLALDGVGNYIACAVECFAFNQDVAVVDANIIRILARVFSLELSSDSHKRKEVWNFVQSLVPHKAAKTFSWAMIDIGRTVCTQKNPRCGVCPLRTFCDFACYAESQ